MKPIDEARPTNVSAAPRWGVWRHQFDLVRTVDGERYLRRRWIVKTPWGGIALHTMTAPDARAVLHDHPFGFLSVVLRGGYIEQRLDPLTMEVRERMVRRFNRMHTYDAHYISAVRVPTVTLLFIGSKPRTWGFWERVERDVTSADGTLLGAVVPDHDGTVRPESIFVHRSAPRAVWRWTKHEAFDSGHYVP